jgi:DNA-binding NarL/FixJ family response regulator
MDKIAVLLADDHQVVRQGLRALINVQPGIEVIGEAHDGLELLTLVEKLRPDVVVTDISMPNLNGVDAAGFIRKRYPEVQVVILSMHSASSYVVRALRTGALGYVLKSDNIEDVIEAIRTVKQGRRYLSKHVSDQVISSLVNAGDAEMDLENRITEREREILQLVAEGNTNQQISKKLNISIRTVETHRANMMMKLGLSSQADVIHFAIQHGMVSLPD